MPRGPRIEVAGAIHHVTGKATSGRWLFHDDLDRQRYLQLLAREIREREWRLLTFCQLTNHLHLLVQTPEADLGLGFKRIHEDFARHVNRRYALSGHLFGSRFYSGVVSTDRHVVGCLRYIARNPIDAGICRIARDWPWSAHGALAGLVEPPAFLDVGGAYEYLGPNEHEARRNYLRLVSRSNLQLLAELERPSSDGWIIKAVDDFAVPVDELGAFLRLGRTSTYDRLARARRTAGTVPPVRFRTLGTVP